MAYITRANVETLLNITLTPAGIALVDLLIPQVEAYTDDYCGRKWGQSAQTDELHDGGRDVFVPKYVPIASVQSIKVDDVAVAAADIYNYNSHIRLASKAAWGHQNVKISYTPDNTIPADLKLALIRWVSEIFKSQEDAGKAVSKYSLGPMSVEFLTQDGIPKFVEMVLNKYRLVPGF